MKLLDLLAELKSTDKKLLDPKNIFNYDDFVTRLKVLFGNRKLVYYIDDYSGDCIYYSADDYCEIAQNAFTTNQDFISTLFSILKKYNPSADYTDDYSGTRDNTQIHTGTDKISGTTSKDVTTTTESSGNSTVTNNSESSGTANSTGSVYAYDQNTTNPVITPNTSDTATNEGKSSGTNTSEDSANSTVTVGDNGTTSSTTTYDTTTDDSGSEQHTLTHTTSSALYANIKQYYSAIDYVCNLIVSLICVSVGF